MIQFGKNEWWKNDPEELMTHVYWLRDQIPPCGDQYIPAWNQLVKVLSKDNPPPKDWTNRPTA